jgi:hypothetical protein
VTPRIIGLVCRCPEWWTATAALWTTVPDRQDAANE